jgi:hypothetical protein
MADEGKDRGFDEAVRERATQIIALCLDARIPSDDVTLDALFAVWLTAAAANGTTMKEARALLERAAPALEEAYGRHGS